MGMGIQQAIMRRWVLAAAVLALAALLTIALFGPKSEVVHSAPPEQSVPVVTIHSLSDTTVSPGKKIHYLPVLDSNDNPTSVERLASIPDCHDDSIAKFRIDIAGSRMEAVHYRVQQPRSSRGLSDGGGQRGFRSGRNTGNCTYHGQQDRHPLTVRILDGDDYDIGSQNRISHTVVSETHRFRVSDASANEGSCVNFTVSLNPSVAAPETASVTVSTTGGTATSGTDFNAVSSRTLTFMPGEERKRVCVWAKGDSTSESNENFTLNLSGASVGLIDFGDANWDQFRGYPTPVVDIQDNQGTGVIRNVGGGT